MFPFRGALGDESLYALLRILARHELVEIDILALPEGLVERKPGGPSHGAAGHLERGRAEAPEHREQLVSFRLKLRFGDDVIDQAEQSPLFGRQQLAREYHLSGLLLPDYSREHDRRERREDPELD